MGTIVDNIIVTVDKPLGFHLLEGREDLVDHMWIKGKDAAGPVGGETKAFELLVNESGIFLDEV